MVGTRFGDAYLPTISNRVEDMLVKMYQAPAARVRVRACPQDDLIELVSR
jgi:hypothetical protein